MSFCRVVLRTAAREGGEAGDVLARANAILAGDNAECMFVTLALGILDLATGELDFASGGHEETFLLPASGGAEPLGRTGPALGIIEAATFGGRRVVLAPGDTVVFATDGVTEAFDPARAMYGRARLVERLADAPASRPAELVSDLETDVARFVRGAPQSDDITVVALTFRGPVGR
jgi:sigma-B regulation protein RsbU (phosphoserine phosphatase)